MGCRNLARRHAQSSTAGQCSQCGVPIDYLAPANGGGRRLTPISKRLCDNCRRRSASLYLSAEELRARDGDDCSICRLPVPENVPRLHPLAAEVDHVVPIARGGTHDPLNLALAHKSCNLAKRDKIGWRRDPTEVQPLLDEWAANPNPVLRAGCTADSCDRQAGTKGLCDKHYWRFRKYGTTELPAKPSVCVEPKCGNPVRARGLCRSHYSRWLRSKSGCSVEGCMNGSHTRGLCKSHYNRWLLDRPNHPRCSEIDCTRISEVRGLCNLHYSRRRAVQRRSAENS
ncbi:HNH endonuclease [Nocardia farcinica]|uniref:HNH endonuclease n=1 Tax=Nocardia farcinica TaxID=37329 RepID=UPI003CC7D0D1